MAAKYYLTPGEYAAREDERNKRYQYGVWRAERAKAEFDTRRALAYEREKAEKARKAAGLSGLMRLGGAAAGGVAGGLFAGPLGAIAGAGLGSALGGTGADIAGVGSGQGGGDLTSATGTAASALAAREKEKAGTLPQTNPNAALMLQNPEAFKLQRPEDEELLRSWYASRAGQ